MEKIRKGNDIEVLWAIYAGEGINEAPYDLTGKNLTLYVRNQFGRKEVYDFEVNKHVLRWMFWGKDQSQLGKYSLELVENEGRQGMHTVDECDAFQLVSHSCETGGDNEGRVECIHLQFRANMGVFTPTIGGGIEVDDALSLESTNPVQNKVITLALQNEIKRAKEEESRLERSFENFDKKIELVEDSVDVLDKTAQKIIVQNELIETKLERVNEKIDALNLDNIEVVLTKVETMESDLNGVKKSIDELEDRVDTLDADVDTEGSVDNKIANALGWEEIE